jgi:DNA-binding CsgD family transcriptional regulator
MPAEAPRFHAAPPDPGQVEAQEGGATIDSTQKGPMTGPKARTSLMRRIFDPAMQWDTHIGPLNSDDPRLRTLVAHLAALAAALAILGIQGPGAMGVGQIVIAVAIGIGFSLLHVLSVRRKLAVTTLMLDAVGMVLLVMGTGAPTSPFYVLALAGVWWAAHVPRPRSGLIYGLTFASAYALLVVPQALREQMLVEAFEDGSVLIILAFLADWFVRVDRRALELSEALNAPRFGPEHIAIREGLERALGNMDVPLDVVLAAGHLGLTAIQAELLTYLVIGLTNMEISDATRLSEAAVRYRLTRLYRTLGVSGRREAADRARELGLPGPI